MNDSQLQNHPSRQLPAVGATAEGSERPAAAPDQFTIARIAAVLGRDVRSLREALRDREPDGHCIVSGNTAKTYLVSSLSQTIQTELAERARRRGFECTEKMLSRDEQPWEPAVSIAELHPEEVTKAKKRALALADFVRAYSFGTEPTADVHEKAANAHHKLVGHELSLVAVDNILKRVIRRDGGREEFCRWELYLPEMPKRSTQTETTEADDRFNHVDVYIDAIDPLRPTVNDRSWVWTAMCENLEAVLDAGAPLRTARRRLVAHVFKRAPWLASSKDSLTKCFAAKWERFCSGARFIDDQRPGRSGNFRGVELTEEDELKLIARGLHGGVSKAWRDSLRDGVLSTEVAQTFISNPSRKSYVPARVRSCIAPQVELLDDIHHGPRQAKLKGAHITRDWSGVMPGDWYQSDDCTLPVYYWDIGPDGLERAIRGQFLPMIDLRSLFILRFALHCDRNYTATAIRGLILRTHDVFGLPRKGYYFENGMWRKAKLLKGSGDEIPGEEAERGLKDYGVTFMHAQLPRGKVIERVLGILQTETEDQPGYVGRDEKSDRFERVQRKLQLARAGNLQYSSFLLHRDEWITRLEKVCDRYNCERQEGNLKNLSPRETWEALFDYKKPLVRLEGAARFLLANHRRPVKVTRNGITIQIGNERYCFRSDATSALFGLTVQCYFDPEDMSSICVRLSNADQPPIVVPLVPAIPAMDASPAQLSAALQSCAAHNRHAVTLYGKVSTYFPKNGPSLFRQTLVSPGFNEETATIEQQKQASRTTQAESENKKKQLARFQRALGKIPGSDAVSEARRLKSYQLIQDINRNGNTQTKS